MQIATRLKQAYFFQELTDQQLDLLAGMVKHAMFSAGTIIFYEGDEGDSCYVITSGSVRITQVDKDAGEEEVAILRSGSVVGELALLGNHVRMASATCLEATEALRLDETDLLLLLEDNPELAANFYRGVARGLAKRLKETTGEMVFLKGFVHTHGKHS